MISVYFSNKIKIWYRWKELIQQETQQLVIIHVHSNVQTCSFVLEIQDKYVIFLQLRIARHFYSVGYHKMDLSKTFHEKQCIQKSILWKNKNFLEVTWFDKIWPKFHLAVELFPLLKHSAFMFSAKKYVIVNNIKVFSCNLYAFWWNAWFTMIIFHVLVTS